MNLETFLQKLLAAISWWKDNLGAVVAAHSPTNSKPTPEQVAQESYLFWKTKTTNHNAIFALLGSEQGETSFVLGVVGDHGEAHGVFQHHQARIDIIQKGCSINIKDCTHLQNLEAGFWEMNNGVYRHVWPKLTATTSIRDAVTVLVHDYEQSGSQSRDVDRRTGFAETWQKKLETSDGTR